MWSFGHTVRTYHNDGNTPSHISDHSDGGLLFRDQHWRESRETILSVLKPRGETHVHGLSVSFCISVYRSQYIVLHGGDWIIFLVCALYYMGSPCLGEWLRWS